MCDFLLELGASSASVVDADAGTPDEEPIFSDMNDPWQDTVNWAAPFWNRCNIIAQFPSAVYESLDETIVPLLKENEDWEYIQVIIDGKVPNRDWVTHVQKDWKPLVVADTFLLQFPWHDSSDLEPFRKVQTDLIDLRLQGGVAFGTGEHATTQLCLEWLSTCLSSGDCRTVLDYGTGSGILGIAACLLSEKKYNTPISATGVDVDTDACRIANANADINQVDMRNYLPPINAAVDNESRSLLMRAHQMNNKDSDDDLVWESNEQFDIVVANILAGPLIALAPVLANLCKGAIGMSGILPHQGEAVVEAYTKAGFSNVRVAKELNGWVLVTGDNTKAYKD